MMNRTTLLRTAPVLALLLAAASLAAQEGASERVFAPFVSNLEAQSKDGKAALSWTDARDATGPAFVFRSASPYAPETRIEGKPIAEVPYGAQSYLDEPPKAGTWYYFVAASDPASGRFDLVIPYANAAGVAWAPPAPVQAAAAPAPAAPPPAASGLRIRDAKAAVRGDAVLVSFSADIGIQGVLVYRSASPIERTSDLLDAVIVQAAPATAAPVVDYPVPGIPYYYALVPEDDLKAGKVSLVKGGSATALPVEVPAGRYRVGLPGPPKDIRAMPLPLISPDSVAPDTALGSPPPAVPVELSPAAAKAVAELIGEVKKAPAQQRKARAFPQDLEAPTGGDEYALRSVVQGPFAKKDWDEASKQFSRFLSLSRSPKSEARARYYLGQAYYFQGRYSDALFEFLLAQSSYYAESQEWIDAVLPLLGAARRSSVSAGS